MTWRVHWSTAAEAELANIWLESKDRSVINSAAASIEKQLATAADQAGESRSDDIRVLCILPLVTWFIVFPKSQSVMVIHVRNAVRRN